MTPARFRWGILLVTIGLLLLLRNIGVLNDDFWVDLLIYFPVILIAIGIEKIFTKSKLQFISYLTSVFIIVAGLGVAFYGGTGGYESSFFSETSHLIEDDPAIKAISAELNLNQTDLTIRDSDDDLVYGDFDRFTVKPRISYRVEDHTGIVTLNSRHGSYLGGAIKINTDDDQNWYIRFSKRAPLDLRLSGNNSDIHMNMSTTPLKNLHMDFDEAHIYLKLGDLERLVSVTVDGEDSYLKLRFPKTVGLRITGEDYRSYLSYLETIGFVEDVDGTFVTHGFDSLKTKIELNLDERLSSLSIDCF
ncbi:MAG: DUF5668 domain-containing protein [candidate division Zixibacteria bacterium]|nr:DUF5668 domain-containing protein [candidate division Zixibacteria bacterium]